ncbi:MAG: hypothetical protein AAB131_05225 [Actinomycetota bacterium]
MDTASKNKEKAVSRSTAAPSPLGQLETLIDMLKQSGRGIVPIRKTFVQQGERGNRVPGPLATFVSTHDQRALDAYLFVHALASAEPWNCDYPAGMWVRALGLADAAEPASARSAVSKVMKRLEDRQLISRNRAGRKASITLLKEDGSGDPYEHPHKAGDGDNWLQLPHAYWLEEFHQSLSLPAKAMLLVALSLPDGFPLPADRVPKWYGISADSAERGLRELRKAGVLDVDEQWVKNAKSETGWTQERHYTLDEPFSSTARKKAAATDRRGRRGRATGGEP